MEIKAKMYLSLLFKQKCIKDECHIYVGEGHSEGIMILWKIACSISLEVGVMIKRQRRIFLLSVAGTIELCI